MHRSLALATLLVATLPGSARAQDACGAELAAVEDALPALGGSPEALDTSIETKLAAKVAAASHKLGEGKPGDAAQKIEDVIDTVEALLAAPKAKIDASAGEALLEAADAAHACLIAGS